MSSPATNDPWAVYSYEMQMIQGLAKFLNQHEMAKLPLALRNAIIESAALHTRVLCELLLSTGKQPDDIKLSDLMPNIDPVLIAELRKAYGRDGGVGAPYWQ